MLHLKIHVPGGCLPNVRINELVRPMNMVSTFPKSAYQLKEIRVSAHIYHEDFLYWIGLKERQGIGKKNGLVQVSMHTKKKKREMRFL